MKISQGPCRGTCLAFLCVAFGLITWDTGLAETRQYECRNCGISYAVDHPIAEAQYPQPPRNEVFCEKCSADVIQKIDVTFCGCGKELARSQVHVLRGYALIFPIERIRHKDNIGITWDEGRLFIDVKGMKAGEFYRVIHSGTIIHQLQCFNAVRCDDCKRKQRLDMTEVTAERAGEYFGRFSLGLGKGFLKGILKKE